MTLGYGRSSIFSTYFPFFAKLYKDLSSLEDMQKKGIVKNDFFKELRKQGQVTIFVIIALLIVGIALLLLLWPKIKTTFVKEINPQDYIKSCTEEYVQEAVNLASKRGGSISPAHAVTFGGEKIEYLCYTNEFYKTCVMQQPLLKQHVEYEIVNAIKPRIEGCITELKGQLEKRGYTVTSNRPDVSASIIPENININIKLGMSVAKEKSVNYDVVTVSVKNRLYDLILISTSILNFEARLGDSDPLNYMFYYPDLKIQKLKQDDGTKIYILEDRETGQIFQFASRSLSWPAGYTGEDVLR